MRAGHRRSARTHRGTPPQPQALPEAAGSQGEAHAQVAWQARPGVMGSGSAPRCRGRRIVWIPTDRKNKRILASTPRARPLAPPSATRQWLRRARVCTRTQRSSPAGAPQRQVVQDGGGPHAGEGSIRSDYGVAGALRCGRS
jgi:hypothetical protein